MRTRRDLVPLSLAVAAALAFRLYRLADRSFWIDEVYSVLIRGSSSATSIVIAPTKDTHPPLGYLVLHYWMELFGNSVFAMRLPAVIFGVAGVIATYKLGETLFDRRVGLIAATIVALSPMHVHASRNVRMYSLLFLLSVLSIYFFVVFVRDDSLRNAALYLTTTVLLVTTHTYAIFVIAAQNAYVLAFRFTDRRTYHPSFSVPEWFRLQTWTGIVALPLVFRMLELLYRILTGATEGLVGWMPPADVYMVLESFLSYAGQPSHYPYLVESTATRALSYLVLLVAVVCFGIAFGEHRFRREDRGSKSGRVDGLYLLAIVLLSAVFLPYAISKLVTPVYNITSTIIGLVPFAIIVAVGISRIPKKNVRALTIVFLVGSLSVLGGVYLTAGSVEPWQDVADDVTSNATPDDLVVFHPYWIDSSYDYYANRSDYETDGYTLAYSNEEARRLRDRARRHDRIWIISRFDNRSADLRDTANRTHSLRSHRTYGRVDIYLYVRSDDGRQERSISGPTSNAARSPVPRVSPRTRRTPPDATPPPTGRDGRPLADGASRYQG